eukprot:605520-Amphidinium_carterae.1
MPQPSPLQGITRPPQRAHRDAYACPKKHKMRRIYIYMPSTNMNLICVQKGIGKERWYSSSGSRCVKGMSGVAAICPCEGGCIQKQT